MKIAKVKVSLNKEHIGFAKIELDDGRQILARNIELRYSHHCALELVLTITARGFDREISHNELTASCTSAGSPIR